MIAAARPSYDVVVLGGGPAGCATALALARRGVEHVLVVEAGGYERPRIGESIPPDTRRPLAELGVLEAFLAEGHEPCPGSCSAWGSDELGYNDFILNPHGHGWHLDRRRFDAFLAGAAQARGVELRTRTRWIATGRSGEEPAHLTLLEAGRGRARVEARVVVDATGPGALFSRRHGARRRRLDELTTATGYFDIPQGVEFPALTVLEAVESGWWYAGRLPGRRVAVLAASSGEVFRKLGLRRRQHWLAALAATHHLGPALAPCRPLPTQPEIRPATSFVLSPLHGTWSAGRWLAVGDAASCFDPITSQGIHKALDDGLRAGRAIAGLLRGDTHGLRAYAQHVESRFGDYQAQRAYFYGLERRWPDAPFWSERRGKGLDEMPGAARDPQVEVPQVEVQ